MFSGGMCKIEYYHCEPERNSTFKCPLHKKINIKHTTVHIALKLVLFPELCSLWSVGQAGCGDVLQPWPTRDEPLLLVKQACTTIARLVSAQDTRAGGSLCVFSCQYFCSFWLISLVLSIVSLPVCIFRTLHFTVSSHLQQVLRSLLHIKSYFFILCAQRYSNRYSNSECFKSVKKKERQFQ